jgi:biotin carboxyl carrier protein
MNEYVVVHKDKRNLITISANSEIVINGILHHYELIVLNNSTFRLRIDQKIYDISPLRIDNNRFNISLEGYTFETAAMTTLQEKASKVIEQTGAVNRLREIKAPMPGMILKIKKKAGDQIESGESIIILEAMKMENDIKSPSSGVIKNIFVSESSAVEKGAKLFSIE